MKLLLAGNTSSIDKYIEQQDQAWKEKYPLQNIEIAFGNELLQYAERCKYYFGFANQYRQNDLTVMSFLNANLELLARWVFQFLEIRLQSFLRLILKKNCEYFPPNSTIITDNN